MPDRGIGDWKESLSRCPFLRLEDVSPRSSNTPAQYLVGVSPDGERVITGHVTRLCLRDRRLKPLELFPEGDRYQHALFLPDGTIVCGGQGTMAAAFDPDLRKLWSWQEESPLRTAGPLVTGMAMARDGSIALASATGVIVWLDAKTGAVRRRLDLRAPREMVVAADREMDQVLTSVLDDRELRLRSLEDGSIRPVVKGGPLPAHGFVGPGGAWAVTWGVFSGDTEAAKLWDLRTPVALGRRPESFSGERPYLVGGALHPDGRHWMLIVTRTLLIFELASPEPVAQIDLGGIPMPHDPPIFTADGARLVMCIGDEAAAIAVDLDAIER